jgi:hypothetical protein
MISGDSYILNIKIDTITLPIEASKIEVLTITQDIDKFLPVLKLRICDPTGGLTHILPYDKSANTVSIELTGGDDLTNLNEFKFTVKRRVCHEGKHEITAVLDVKDLFLTAHNRIHSGNLKANLELIALSELGVYATEVGTSLSFDKAVLQPGWINSTLLNYLKSNIVGRSNEAGYVCFIKNEKGKQIFVFKSLDELYSANIKHQFVVGVTAVKDHYLVSKYKILDNSEIITDFGAKNQSYEYFDYATGTYISDSIPVEDFTSLTDQFLINNDDVSDSSPFQNLGRSNDFTPDFDGRVRNNYYSRLGQLVSMWISTQGLENASPGDMVRVVFSEMFQRKELFVYQHSGFWMIKRVVHMVGPTFLTNLLLVRNGVDTDQEHTLLKPTKQKKL